MSLNWTTGQVLKSCNFSNFVNCFTECLQVPVRQKTTRIGSSADINYASLCICCICHLWFQIDLLRNVAVSLCRYCKSLTFEAITSRMNYVAEYAVKEKRHPFMVQMVQMVHPYLKFVSCVQAGKLYCPCRCAGSIKWIHGSAPQANHK